MKKLLAKINKVQGQIGAIPRTGTNPAFKSRYATLDDILETVMPILSKAGLVLTHELDQDAGLTTCIIDVESGEERCVTFPMVESGSRGNAVQGFGSYLTYARRYGITMLFSLRTEDDDDGNAMKGTQPKAKPKPKAKKEAPPIRVMKSQDFERFLEVLKSKDADKRANALKAVRAKNYTWTPEQRKALEAMDIDPEKMQYKIPFE